MIDEADLVIVGGGPVGATLALALEGSGLSVMLLEARADVAAKRDPRTLALSHGSRQILERLGIWQSLPAPTPIETIHVSQKGGLGRCVLKATDEGLPALGYVVNYAALDAALHTALLDSGTRYLTGAHVDNVTTLSAHATVDFERQGAAHQVRAKLVALADGGRNLPPGAGVERQVREYGQCAVIAQVSSALPHGNVAYERFSADGPIALLPCGEEFSLVWTAAPERAQALCQMPEADFLEALHAHFGDRVGRFTGVGQRFSFPLALKYARPVTASRLVLIGNAAQTLHPVTGQGFNLGLRDAWDLNTEIRSGRREEVGSDAMLARYRSRRRLDTRGGIFFTDTLVRIFSNGNPLLHHARGLALGMLTESPLLKRFITRKMIYGARG